MVGFPDNSYYFSAPNPPSGYEETNEGDGGIMLACGRADGVYVDYRRFAKNSQNKTMYLQVRFTEYGGTGTWKSYDNHEELTGYGCTGTLSGYYSERMHYGDEVITFQLIAIVVVGLILWAVVKLILGRLLKK